MGTLESGYFRLLHETGSNFSAERETEFKNTRRRLTFSYGVGVLLGVSPLPLGFGTEF